MDPDEQILLNTDMVFKVLVTIHLLCTLRFPSIWSSAACSIVASLGSLMSKRQSTAVKSQGQ